MATVIPGTFREQESHFGLYRTSAGGDESIIVRRKIGEPTDYMHRYSKALHRQREIFTQASQHYAHLTPSQKASWRQQIRWVSRIPPGSKSEEVLLQGRQLFISEDIHELATRQRLIILPLQICIVLTDQNLNPIEGQLCLRYKQNEDWLDCEKVQISPYDWLFPSVPRQKATYHPYGEAEGYEDQETPASFMDTTKALQAYHYHPLLDIAAILNELYKLPFNHRTYSCWGWYISSVIKLTKPIKQIAIYSKLTTHGFDGTFTIGIKEPFYPPPPPEWIVSKKRQVSLDYWETRYYLTLLPATTLIPNINYAFVLQMANTQQPYWWGYNDIWLLPEAVV